MLLFCALFAFFQTWVKGIGARCACVGVVQRHITD